MRNDREFRLIATLSVALVLIALSLGGDPAWWWITALWDFVTTAFEWVGKILLAALWAVLVALSW